MHHLTLSRRAALAAAAATLAAGGARAQSRAPSGARVGFFTEAKPTMIAKGEGWFAEGIGAPIAWTEYGSGAEINTAMVGGSCDIGLATGSVATASGIAQGLPFQVVGLVDNIGPAEEMTVRTAANIRTPADFRGKKVATPFGSTSHFRLLGFLKTNNLTQRDVTVLDMRPAAIEAAWARGEIDAAYVWAPVKSRILAAGGSVYRTWDTLDRAGYAIADVIIVHNNFARDYPDAVVGFLRAYGRALAMWRTSPDEAARIVAQQAGVTPEVAKAEMEAYEFIDLAGQTGEQWLGVPGRPGKFAEVLKGTADFLVEQRSIRSAPGVEVFGRALNSTFLQRAVA
jgi:taurine transport system substrate-binding protein